MRCHWNRKGCELSTPASQPAQAKTGCYQRKCKIFFCWTRKIQYQSVHPSNFKQFCRVASEGLSSGPALAPQPRTGRELGREGARIYTFYTIIERVQSESRGKTQTKNESDALSGEFLNFCIGSYPATQQLLGRRCTFFAFLDPTGSQ